MNRHDRRLAHSKRLAWFREFADLGYSIERSPRGGHFKVRDPDGALAATVSASPSNPSAHRGAQADIRRHERRRHRPDERPNITN